MAGWRLVLVIAGVLESGWLTLACPQNCVCRYEQGLFVANCSSLPSEGGKIEALSLLPSSRPLELSERQFILVRHLKYLSLKNCSIYNIDKKDFYGAKNVLEVDLSYNRIKIIDPAVFQGMKSLDTLILRGNPIQFLPQEPFLISNSLQHLDIGECAIKRVPSGIFYGLKRLKYLSLDKNLLKSIEYNSLPKGLKYLDISNNHIVNVPTGVLSSLSNLTRLGLRGNPINCSCSLMNLQDRLSGRAVIFVGGHVICNLPLRYRGVSWSEVDEKALCIDEERREEKLRPVYKRLIKNKAKHRPVYKRLIKNKAKYLENENNYLAEDFQSDQPQSQDLQVEEVSFKNEETFAMGKMMRDEDGKTGLTESVQTDDMKEEIFKDKTEDRIESAETNSTASNTETQEEDGGMSETQNVKPNTAMDLSEPETKTVEPEVKQTSEHSKSKAKLHMADTVNLNDSKLLEFKTTNEDELNTEKDDLKKEGLMKVDQALNEDTNSTEEVSTNFPDEEQTTEYEISSSEKPLTSSTEESNNDDGNIINVSSTTEISIGTTISSTNEISIGTTVEYPSTSEEDTNPLTTLYPDVSSESNKNETNSTEIPMPKINSEPDTGYGTIDDSNNNDKKELSTITRQNKEEKIKEAAGAEVVIFCVGILIICLILYSVYKFRTFHRRQSMRIVKDKPSNHDTEMQDMASLLPKPQEDNKIISLKYTDKALASETENLISGKNEKELPTARPPSEIQDKVEDNVLNNNTPGVGASPTSKTPLIQAEKPITINPAVPIQRTKVKLETIPDSIPRIPIFLQKTHNGTKNF